MAGTRALAEWALGFSPRVCRVDEAVLLEAQASERLFGGRRALWQRLREEARPLGVPALACAPTALGALALMRQALHEGRPAGGCGVRQLGQRLDALPLDTLGSARPHADTLAALGCHTLGDVRALPRNGVARRFGAGLLDALDRAYGLQPDSFSWLTMPERFDRSLECPAAVEHGPGLLFGTQRLLQSLHLWLQERQLGVVQLVLHWRHDSRRTEDLADGRLEVRTAIPTRDVIHLGRLLAEHLARIRLTAPVRCLRLEAAHTEALRPENRSLLPDAREQGETLSRFIERVAARLGGHRVLRPMPVADHRPERMTRWVPAADGQPARPAPALAETARQPGWLLPQPLRLAVQGHRPLYQGPLVILAGPERLETGWWPEVPDAAPAPGVTADGMPAPVAPTDGPATLRDYFVAESASAGLLWIFRVRGAGQPAWYLHGFYG